MLALRLMVLYLVASVGTGFALRPMPAASRQRRRGGVGGAGVRMMGGAGDGAVVGEYMTTPCISVTPNMSLKDAAKILVDRKIAGAPVTSRDNKVIGVISQFDFLFKEAGPGAVKPLNLNSPTYRTDAQKMMSNKVRFSMTPDPVTITSSCTMTDAATIMLGEKLNRLPVVDDEGDLVGLLSASDVMRHLTCDPEEDCRVN